VPSHQAELL